MYGEYIQILLFTGFVIFEVSPNVNPECIGWHLLIDCIVKNQAYHLRHRIGIVVDSELGNLKSINSREQPYYLSYYIPENIQLLYASDKGKDLTNMMLSACHKIANKVMKFYREHDIVLHCHKNGDCNFRGFRRIRFKTPPNS
jgi:hypothetical protein